MTSKEATEILRFWFDDAPAATPEALMARLHRWYRGGPDLDDEIRRRFGALVETAVGGGLAQWEADPDGLLALILLLDQFTRSIDRDTPRAYAGDARAQALALAALDAGVDRDWDAERKQFLRMPLLHAEDVALQERSVAEIEAVVDAAPEPLRPVFGIGREQARKYLGIVRRFGRFPHRNAILGRPSTPEEAAFLVDWADNGPPAAMRAAKG